MARGLALIAGLSVLSMTVEAIGVLTGVPYGWFQYSGSIGTAVIGPVPWTVGFAYVPLLLGACALARRFAACRSFWVQVVLSAVLLVAADWSWTPERPSSGTGYGRILGCITGSRPPILSDGSSQELYTRRLPSLSSGEGCRWGSHRDFVLILAFWTGVSLGSGMVVPAAIGFGLLFIVWLGQMAHHGE